MVAGILGGGSEGFGAWEGVRVGLEEVVRRAVEGEGEITLRALEPQAVEGMFVPLPSVATFRILR